jgi:hypothetical protein
MTRLSIHAIVNPAWLLGAALMLIGCGRATEPRLIVEGHPPREWTYPASFGVTGEPVTGEINWYTARDLDRIVRAYVRQNGVRFSFKGTDAQFWVGREREHLASGTYSSGIGEPVLSIDIGWDGRVKGHRVGIAVCRLTVGETPSVAPPPPAPEG